ncbi:hypothetical protein [Gemmatimonas groenlandica]|uniref:Uncharacterized protein n=1 Tax=Gemmatimonas groenlandica TaxID=2732249 RepID=A0A6M4IWG4_9BACT|nr:hypothetical protein [Gemmatimonas groenlandica]QJR37232.1 hypothetical protein HKW67_17770 [Gemmatimonas groenlandica]
MTARGLIVLSTLACIACAKPTTPESTLKVSYYAQDSAFASAEPLRVDVGSGEQLRSLRGIELAPYHPFLVSGVMPLDTGATLPITVVMLGANADTAAKAQLTFGPIESATSYTLGVSAGGRNPSSAPSRCGVQVAVPMTRAGGVQRGDSLFVSIAGVRDGKEC